MKKVLRAATLMAAISFTSAAHASLVDFATQPTNTTGDTTVSSITVGDITATAYYDPTDDGINNWAENSIDATLWRRNNSNDHGLGVCSKVTGLEEPCSSGGDYNELSQRKVDESIGLAKLESESWTSLWVSSLDSSETGTLWWDNSSDPNSVIGIGNSASFSAGIFGSSVEGDLIAYLAGVLTPAELISLKNADNLFFTAGGDVGQDNDYLVWKAETKLGPAGVVPVPAAAWLFGSGLLGLIGMARRKKA